MLTDVVYREVLRLSAVAHRYLAEHSTSGAEVIIEEMNELLDEATRSGIVVSDATIRERDEVVKFYNLFVWIDSLDESIDEKIESFKRSDAC